MEQKHLNNRKDFVEITHCGESRKIHRGRRYVEEIKELFGIPKAMLLNQIKDGKVLPLANDGFVIIKGGENFAHQPCSGHAS